MSTSQTTEFRREKKEGGEKAETVRNALDFDFSGNGERGKSKAKKKTQIDRSLLGGIHYRGKISIRNSKSRGKAGGRKKLK